MLVTGAMKNVGLLVDMGQGLTVNKNKLFNVCVTNLVYIIFKMCDCSLMITDITLTSSAQS